MEKSEQEQPQKENIVISPIQLLVNAVLVAYQRGAFTIKEAGLISQAVDYFTIETKQAKIPEIPNNNNQKEEKEEKEEKEAKEAKEKIIFLSQ
jgi:hypothetical protein